MASYSISLKQGSFQAGFAGGQLSGAGDSTSELLKSLLSIKASDEFKASLTVQVNGGKTLSKEAVCIAGELLAEHACLTTITDHFLARLFVVDIVEPPTINWGVGTIPSQFSPIFCVEIGPYVTTKSSNYMSWSSRLLQLFIRYSISKTRGRS